MVAIAVDYEKAFKNAGVNFDKLAAKGVKVAVNSSGMKFSLGGEVLASAPIPPGKLSELATSFDGKSQSHLTVKASLQNIVAQLEKKLVGPKPETTAKAAPAPAAIAPAPMPSDIKVVPPDKMKTTPPVSLVQATQLFQPVKGTSAGSVYFVVGLGTGIAVAARYKGNKTQGKLSVRIEGAAFPKLAMKIQEAGVFGPAFAGSFDSNYASMHLSVAGKKEVQRVIGAVLGSLAPHIGHATPDLQPLVDIAA